MKVLIVGEGKSELGYRCEDGALPILVKRLLPVAQTPTCEQVSSNKVKTHRPPGRGNGFEKRALAWIRYAERQGFQALVLLIDQDGCEDRHGQLDRAQADVRMGLSRALGVAVRTFDAWMLADEKALSSALGWVVQRQPKPEAIPDPKAVCEDLLKGAGKGEKYAAVATEAEIAVLEDRCPRGFRPFAGRVRAL